MKKFFLFVLALALFIPQIASAKINLYGQLDIMGSDTQWKNMGDTFANGRSFTNTRLLL
jgi:accessory colonization factor AcfC